MYINYHCQTAISAKTGGGAATRLCNTRCKMMLEDLTGCLRFYYKMMEMDNAGFHMILESSAVLHRMLGDVT